MRCRKQLAKNSDLIDSSPKNANRHLNLPLPYRTQQPSHRAAPHQTPRPSNGASSTAASPRTANAIKKWMNFDTSQPQNLNFQTPPALCFRARVTQTTGRPGPKAQLRGNGLLRRVPLGIAGVLPPLHTTGRVRPARASRRLPGATLRLRTLCLHATLSTEVKDL